MSDHEKTVPCEANVDELLGHLAQILASQQKDYQRLAQLIEAKREAVRRADINAITDLCQRENTIAQHVTELEKSRLTLAARLTQELAPASKQPLSMSQLAELLDEPQRTRFLGLSQDLRATIEEVRSSSRIVRVASDALARHMGGLLQVFQSSLSRARVYSDRGQLTIGAQYQFCLDLKS